MEKTIVAITSDDWRIVREFVQQMRLKAHETVVDKSVIQNILNVVEKHNMATVQNMIKHEKRLVNANDIQKFNIQQDWYEEQEYNQGDSNGLSK